MIQIINNANDIHNHVMRFTTEVGAFGSWRLLYCKNLVTSIISCLLLFSLQSNSVKLLAEHQLIRLKCTVQQSHV